MKGQDVKKSAWDNAHLKMLGKGNVQCGENTIEIKEIKRSLKRKSLSIKDKFIIGTLGFGAGAFGPKVYSVAAKLIAIYF